MSLLTAWVRKRTKSSIQVRRRYISPLLAFGWIDPILHVLLHFLITLQTLADEILKAELTNQEYDEDDAKEWSVAISDKVREAVTSKLHVPRYKIIVQTTIGQCNDQGVRVASRCLWNTDTDNYASTSFINKTLFCSVTIFALYTD